MTESVSEVCLSDLGVVLREEGVNLPVVDLVTARCAVAVDRWITEPGLKAPDPAVAGRPPGVVASGAWTAEEADAAHAA